LRLTRKTPCAFRGAGVIAPGAFGRIIPNAGGAEEARDAAADPGSTATLTGGYRVD